MDLPSLDNRCASCQSLVQQGGNHVVALVRTVAYLGLEARAVEVQCSLAPGLPNFNIVGLADKAVGESKERVRAALSSMGLALPP